MVSSSCLARRSLRTGLALLAVVGLLVACGKPQAEAETTGMLTLDARGSRYLALQDGVGDWQLLSDAPDDNGLTTVNLSDPQGRYGVMSVCLDEGSGDVSVQVTLGVLTPESLETALTGNDPAPAVSPVAVRCGDAETPAARAEVRGAVRGLIDGEYGGLYLGNASALIDASAPLTGLEVPRQGASTLDLVATQYAPGALLPRALIVKAFEPAPDEVTPIDLDFGTGEATKLDAAEIPLAGQRSGELLSGSIDLLTRSGTRALLGESVSGSALSYARPPASLLQGAALYAEAQSFTYNDHTKAGSSRSVSRTFWNGAVTPLTLPPPLELRPPVLTGRDDALRPRVSWAAPPGDEGDYTQFYSQVRAGHSVSYRLSQRAGAEPPGAPAVTPLIQTLPDFSGLPGFRAEWNLTRGEDLFWDVSLRVGEEGNTESSSRSGVLLTAPQP